MMVYLSVIALYLVTTGVKESVIYKDLYENLVVLNRDCINNICVLKCCDFGEYLNDDNGACEIASSLNSGYIAWLQETNKNDLTYLRSNYVNNSYYGFFNGSVLGDASLKTEENGTFIKPLEFCEGSQIYYKHGMIRLNTVYKRVDKPVVDDDDIFNRIQLIALGIVITVFVTLKSYYVLRNKRIRVMGIVMACITSVMAVYLVKALEQYLIYTKQIEASQCQSFSPAIYCFILASFCWPNVALYNVLKKAIALKNKTFDAKKGECVLTYFEYALYGWGLPFVVTMILLFGNRMGLDDMLSIEKPPFESCFAKERQTMLYLHIPIVLLLITEIILYVTTLYQITQVNANLPDVPIIKHVKSHHELLGITKIVIAILMSVSMDLLPNVPVLLYYALNIYNLIFVLATILVLIKMRKRSTENTYDDKKVRIFKTFKTLVGRQIPAALPQINLSKGDDQENIVENAEDNNA